MTQWSSGHTLLTVQGKMNRKVCTESSWRARDTAANFTRLASRCHMLQLKHTHGEKGCKRALEPPENVPILQRNSVYRCVVGPQYFRTVKSCFSLSTSIFPLIFLLLSSHTCTMATGLQQLLLQCV